MATVAYIRWPASVTAKLTFHDKTFFLIAKLTVSKQVLSFTVKAYNFTMQKERAEIFIENLELHIKSSNTVLKNYILVVDMIELPAFGEEGWG